MSHEKITIAIADDHELYVDGLAMLLTDEREFEIVAMAHTVDELLKKVEETVPDVAVVDLSMPPSNGLVAIKKISSQTDPRCIAHSSHTSHMSMMEAIAAGAIGYVVKNAKRGEIATAVRSAAMGEPFHCQYSTEVLSKAIAGQKAERLSRDKTFSEKEIMILYLIAQEKLNTEIAAELFLSHRTIEGIRSEMMRKMGVKTATGMIVYALKNNLFDLGHLE